jgi:hypothetical protein
MHLELRGVYKQSRTDKLFVQLVVAKYVTDILAQKALDALPEFLNPVSIRLSHSPGAVEGIGSAGCELPDPLLRAEVGGDIGDQILHRRERAHRLDGHGLLEIELTQPRHAHEAGHAVDLGRAGSTLSCLAVPADREIRRALSLNLVDRIEDDHSFGYARRIILELAGWTRAAPDAKRRGVRFGAGAGVAARSGTLAALDDVSRE